MIPKWKYVRDGALFAGGMLGVYHETFLISAERPTLLLLFAAMMGLPAFLRTDERRTPPSDPPPQEMEK